MRWQAEHSCTLTLQGEGGRKKSQTGGADHNKDSGKDAGDDGGEIVPDVYDGPSPKSECCFCPRHWRKWNFSRSGSSFGLP